MPWLEKTHKLPPASALVHMCVGKVTISPCPFLSPTTEALVSRVFFPL